MAGLSALPVVQVLDRWSVGDPVAGAGAESGGAVAGVGELAAVEREAEGVFTLCEDVCGSLQEQLRSLSELIAGATP
jgi:hypothetical protein